MNTYITKSGAKLPLSEAIAHKIEAATIADARLWNETQDKAVFIVDFLDLVTIDQLLRNPDLEDQVEERFEKLLVPETPSANATWDRFLSDFSELYPVDPEDAATDEELAHAGVRLRR
jgi:hypothetical protein